MFHCINSAYVIEYKTLSWVWGADRQIHSEGHCYTSRGTPSDAKNYGQVSTE